MPQPTQLLYGCLRETPMCPQPAQVNGVIQSRQTSHPPKRGGYRRPIPYRDWPSV
ncbi:hypothetical protein ASPFODRAFT_54330 [Aspergillus luchuensis CBS 106.47]|uniref:Uncharacterized protein n=1 Tax=Aspergillus luchuensis (strain CBS 106.47) TaxID=1137211 RepID=A0A1M3SZJ3_ASPLC|nr:hypothetical protein ASPFODRAFT_54330 [Aspergillus luchuensis CBS 106.47]